MSANLRSAGLGSMVADVARMDGAQWLEFARRHAPQLVAALAIVGLAWQAADLTWLLLGLRSSPGAAGGSTITNLNNSAATTVDPNAIARAHLFGTPGAGSNPADPNSLPRAQVNLVLAGTMALNDPEAGFAIVGDNAANAKFYRVGATINGGVRLHSVYVDRVVIERNGTLETLTLPRGPSSAAFAPAPARPIAANPAAENLRRLANASPETINNLLRSQPVFANGALRGFRVYPGRDRQQFVRAGLQPGDLVTAINGTALDDPNRSNEILNTLASSATAMLSVERNGVMQQVNLDMTQLSIPDPASDSASSAANPRGILNGPPPGSRGTPPTSGIE